MRILVTGANGFIGKNLIVHLNERTDMEVLKYIRGDSLDKLNSLVAKADMVIHLAGENRPKDISEFAKVNTGLTYSICDAIRANGRLIPLVLASSSQAEMNNPYGNSKREAEKLVEALASETGNPVAIYRLPGVFGKWCKPNYNSVVATFCHNIARDLPITISDPAAVVRLVYIDDVIAEFLRNLAECKSGIVKGEVKPVHSITLGELAVQIQSFRNCRTTLKSERVGMGLTRALYSTYISYLPPAHFSYELPVYADDRGVFVEMLKTHDSGQFSFFTVYPGVTRGSHYHHSKTEKFLIVKGVARMRFRHLITGEINEIIITGDKPQVVDTIPGWVHDITNIGQDEVVVMLWANENFDREQPDTVACKV